MGADAHDGGFLRWDLGDDAFEAALRALEARACAAEKLGVRWAYNHVWLLQPAAV